MEQGGEVGSNVEGLCDNDSNIGKRMARRGGGGGAHKYQSWIEGEE